MPNQIANDQKMDKNQTEDPTIAKPVIEMLTVANEYCLFFEKAASYKTAEILDYYHKIAPLLYLKGAILPDLPLNNEAHNERYVTEEEWETVFKELREKFGKIDVYYIHDHNFDSVEASLADNMADIYQDMKDFVMLYQKNIQIARQNAIANLSSQYRWRWGPAAIQALGAVHQLLFKEDISPDILKDENWELRTEN